MPGPGFDVESEVLRHYADAAEQSADRMRRIRQRMSELDLSDGVFGQLPESNSLRADYLDKKRQAEEDMGAAAEALESIAEAARSTGESYDSTEESNRHTVGGEGR